MVQELERRAAAAIDELRKQRDILGDRAATLAANNAVLREIVDGLKRRVDLLESRTADEAKAPCESEMGGERLTSGSER